MASITINNLSKSYGDASDIPAVKNINVSVPDGTFLTLLGPSGCGKTTTLRLLAGYITPDTGEILVGSRQVSAPNQVVPPEGRGMGMVFQNYAIWPHKTVFENVAFGLKLRKESSSVLDQKVKTALEQVGLLGFERRYPNELSGGQQQRVALARSLVVEPEILLLDEPLSNLDAKLREKMRSELKELQRRTGITFIYVTHDQAEALALSDMIVVMHKGEVQQVGSPEEVYSRPSNRQVADFMGLINTFNGRLEPSLDNRASITFCQGNKLEIAAPSGINEPVDVEFVIRPEDITLVPEAHPDAILSGKVTAKTFLGNLLEVMVELPSGQQLRVQAHPLSKYDVGQAVGLILDGAAITVFL
ncbi:MAG: ABC transporter ATP-binding protein [Burkholderiaceae bacterium]